jgi:hypothetical protein
VTKSNILKSKIQDPRASMSVLSCDQGHTAIDLHLSVGYDKFVSTTTKGSKMTLIQLGQELTTKNSGVKGTVREIVQNSSGSVRVRLDVKGKERWTTVKPEYKIVQVAI